MARVVSALEDKKDDEDGDYGRFSDYPWSEWTDGKVWEVVQGDDFSVAIKTFRVYLYQWKDMMNAKQVPTPDESVESWVVHTRIVAPQVIRFQFEPDPF